MKYAAILILFTLTSCATREKGVVLNGQETLLLPFPDDYETRQYEDMRLLRNNPVFRRLYE